MTTRVSPIGSPTYLLLDTDDERLQVEYNQMDATLQSYWGRGFRNVEDYDLVCAALAERSKFLVKNGFLNVDEAWQLFIRNIIGEADVEYVGNLDVQRLTREEFIEKVATDNSDEEQVFSEADLSD